MNPDRKGTRTMPKLIKSKVRHYPHHWRRPRQVKVWKLGPFVIWRKTLRP